MRKIKKQKGKKKLTVRQIIMRTVKSFFFVVFLCVLGWLLWGFQTGYIQHKWIEAKICFHTEMGKAGFVVDEAFIDGRIRTPFADIQQALDLKQGTPMTLVDIEQMKSRLEELPWIKSATIKRKLPNILSIYLTERRPIALWQKNNVHHPLDEDGQVIATSAKGLEYLIITVGDDAPQHTPELIDALMPYPELTRRVISAVRIGGRRWNLILDDVQNGMLIFLPEENIKEALNRLDKLNKEHALLNRQLTRIDLRLPDRLIVQTIDNQPIEPLRSKAIQPIKGGHGV